MAARGLLRTNWLPVHFDRDTIRVRVRKVAERENLALLRQSLRDDHFVYWDRGEVYMLPLVESVESPANTRPAVLGVDQSFRLLARLVTDALARRFPSYEPIQAHPFTFLSHKVELVGEVSTSLGLKNPLLSDFKIHPKYVFDTRIIQVPNKAPFVAIVVDLATHWAITADLDALVEAGIDVSGLYVVRRDPDPGQRRLVGRIASVESGRIALSESTDDTRALETSAVMLEGRRDAYSRCLKHLLGERDYARFDTCRDKRTGELLGGPPLLEEVQRVATILAEHPLELAVDLSCSVHKPFEIAKSRGSNSVKVAKRLDYCFDSTRHKRHQYAWPGLEAHGPFSRDTFAKPSPRILVVYPDTVRGQVKTFVQQLQYGIPKQRAFRKGMTQTFGLHNPQFDYAPVSRTHDSSAANCYRQAITDALSQGELPDAAIVIVRDQESNLPDASNPYLHSKALLLMAGVASQEARLSTIARKPSELQYVLQNIAVALYAKMRGVPWTIDHDLSVADELVIGVGTAELSKSRTLDRHRYVGITTVFRGDGNYLLGQLSREVSFAEYPSVLRDTVRDAIKEIKKRNGWQPSDTVRLIFHAARPPKNIDFAELMMEAVKATGDEQSVEAAFLTVAHKHPHLLFDSSQSGKHTTKGPKGEFAPDRGLIVETGKYSRLLTTTGTTLVKRPGLPLPRPLQLHLLRGSTFDDLHYLSEQVLKFTALSWRSTQPAADPVTIYYSELIARLLARMRSVPDWSPALLNARLRTSKWFI